MNVVPFPFQTQSREPLTVCLRELVRAMAVRTRLGDDSEVVKAIGKLLDVIQADIYGMDWDGDDA